MSFLNRLIGWDRREKETSAASVGEIDEGSPPCEKPSVTLAKMLGRKKRRTRGAFGVRGHRNFSTGCIPGHIRTAAVRHVALVGAPYWKEMGHAQPY